MNTIWWAMIGILAFPLLVWGVTMLVIQALRPSKKKKPETHSKPDHPSTSDNHKAQKTGGHGDHDSGHDHHEKKTPWWLSAIMAVLVVVLVFAALRFFIVPTLGDWGFGQAPGASSERRYELSQTHGTKRPLIKSVEWTHRIIAPPKGDLWSAWIDIPPGRTIHFCDKVRDPSCSARSFDDVGFIPQCRSPIDGSPLDWDDVLCRYSDANRIQAKGSKAMLVHYGFTPAP